MTPVLEERPVVGAICLGPGSPEASAALRLIADLGMTMCETILRRGDTTPERTRAILGFLDEAARLGVSVMLEPTYEPDLEAHPEMRNVTSEGAPSTRKNGFCYRNAAYLRDLEQYIAEVCRSYMAHPAILRHRGRPMLAVGHEMQYQISAEDGHGGTLSAMTCYCRDCAQEFGNWLASMYSRSAGPAMRYVDPIERYNKVHRKPIKRFSHVIPPRRPEADRLLWQEWVDFHAEAIPQAIALQRKIIEREVPGALVTHEINDWYPNVWDCIYTGDHFWKMGAVLEHAFNDQYPMEWAPGSLWRIYLYTFTQDVTQSAIGFERSFWANGQAFTSQQGSHTDPPEAGHHEQVYSALIHGANGLIWWTGGDLLPATKEATREYARLVELLGDARPLKDPIALLVPWTTYAQTRSADRGDDLMGAYQLLSRLGYQMETVDEGQVASGILRERGYQALCIWGNSSLAPAARERIEQFVYDGGLLLADFGDRDTAPYGSVFPETISQKKAEPTAYRLPDGTWMLVRARSQVLRRRRGCEVLARFADGSPAIVRYRYRRGTLWRAGSLIGVDYAAGMGLYDWVRQERVRIEPAAENLVGAQLAASGITPLAQADNPNIEVALFRPGGRTMVVVVNHLRHPAKVTLTLRATPIPRRAQDVFTGERIPCAPAGDRAELKLALPELGGRAIWVE